MIKKERELAIYTNFGDRGGPLFRGKITPEVEGSESPNRRKKTRGRNLTKKGGGTVSPKFGKLNKLGLEM